MNILTEYKEETMRLLRDGKLLNALKYLRGNLPDLTFKETREIIDKWRDEDKKLK